ncbi:cobalamin-dependent protein [Bacillus sp. F19]|nr:cobalamin-dependent protein [Bacillus sp. F19]
MNPVKELSQLFIDGEHSLSWNYLNSMIEEDTTSTQVYGFLSDTMDNVGELWEMNRATVADEHVAAAVCKSMIASYYYLKVEQLHKEPNIQSQATMKPRVMLLSMRNEEHTIGMMMTSFLFKEYGWEASCIESNVSMDHICQYAEKWKPDVIAFSTSVICNIPTVFYYMDELQKLNYSPTIMLAGKLTNDFDLDYYCPPNTVVIQNIDQLGSWIEKSNSRNDRHGNAINRK